MLDMRAACARLVTCAPESAPTLPGRDQAAQAQTRDHLRGQVAAKGQFMILTLRCNGCQGTVIVRLDDDTPETEAQRIATRCYCPDCAAWNLMEVVSAAPTPSRNSFTPHASEGVTEPLSFSMSFIK